MKNLEELREILLLFRKGTLFLRLKILLLAGIGAGFSPLAPGSAGTLVAWGAIRMFPLPSWAWLAGGLLFLPLAVLLFRDPHLEPFADRDPPWVVADEIAAFFILFALLSPRSFGEEILLFLLFRVCDALKPFPLQLWERHIQGVPGIMGDDLLAALWVILLVLGLRACGF